jgi:cellulose synthase/poly-beta-1,6-N-acetylglucosamine synthase-like glycosyltransferase
MYKLVPCATELMHMKLQTQIALGFSRLGLACPLMGSGMAFSWHILSQVNFASGHIVEDLKLGIDFAKLNIPPLFCPVALITSEFHSSEEGINTQRTRWEHGHLSMILKEGLPLVVRGVKQANLNMLAMAIDMCLPPLALLVLIIAMFSIVGLLMSAVTLVWYSD